MSDSAADLDVEFLLELLEGDAEFAKELFETYASSAESSLSEVAQLLRGGDHSNVFRPFHTLKGASASVGLVGVRALAREFEMDAKEGRFERCQLRLDELSKAIEIGKGALAAFLERM